MFFQSSSCVSFQQQKEEEGKEKETSRLQDLFLLLKVRRVSFSFDSLLVSAFLLLCPKGLPTERVSFSYSIFEIIISCCSENLSVSLPDTYSTNKGTSDTRRITSSNETRDGRCIKRIHVPVISHKDYYCSEDEGRPKRSAKKDPQRKPCVN
jgi:hypothetical protein